MEGLPLYWNRAQGGLSQYKDVILSVGYTNSHYIDKTITTVLSFYWKSLYIKRQPLHWNQAQLAPVSYQVGVLTHLWCDGGVMQTGASVVVTVASSRSLQLPQQPPWASVQAAEGKKRQHHTPPSAAILHTFSFHILYQYVTHAWAVLTHWPLGDTAVILKV